AHHRVVPDLVERETLADRLDRRRDQRLVDPGARRLPVFNDIALARNTDHRRRQADDKREVSARPIAVVDQHDFAAIDEARAAYQPPALVEALDDPHTA